MNLPANFIDRMKNQLGEESEAFFESFQEKPWKGLRVNTNKISVASFLEIFPYELEPIPWSKDGFYYNEENDVTKHPYYYAGLYYIQEPSAMAPGNILNTQLGDTVLDLCAAPGGKTLQIANDLNETGLLISNDINGKRVKAIVKNIEKFGIKNVVVINNNHEEIINALPGCFDKVLVDAPCSGEGMFRKDKKATTAWLSYDFDHCSQIQTDILSNIHQLFKAYGELVYSTCTYNKDENENQIEKLITERIFHPIDIDNVVGISVDKHIGRVWPHLHRGEGHFISKLGYGDKKEWLQSENKNNLSTIPTELSTFFKDNINTDIKEILTGEIKVVKGRVYVLPANYISLNGLSLVREGWLIGEIKNKRFIPHQAFAMGLKMADVKNKVNYKSDDVEVIKYLKCETLRFESEKGWHLVCVDGYPLGWGKHDGKILKNYYPASWRIQ